MVAEMFFYQHIITPIFMCTVKTVVQICLSSRDWSFWDSMYIP